MSMTYPNFRSTVRLLGRVAVICLIGVSVFALCLGYMVVGRSDNQSRHVDFTAFATARDVQTFLSGQVVGRSLNDSATLNFMRDRNLSGCQSWSEKHIYVYEGKEIASCEALAPANCPGGDYMIECIMYEFVIPSTYVIEYRFINDVFVDVTVKRKTPYIPKWGNSE